MTTYRWTFEEDVRHYAAAGFQGIGVWRQKLSDFGEEKGVELLRESGLRVSSLLWAGGFTGSEGRSYEESVQDAKVAFRTAAAMRAQCLVAYSGARAGHTLNHAHRLLKNALKELLPFAAEFNVPLAIEPMHPGCAADWTFVTSLDATLALLDEIASPYVTLVFDTYHLGHDGAVVDRIGEIVPRVSLVQVGDAKEPPIDEPDRSPLGEGALPLREIISAFDSNGYDGFYEVELMGQEIEVCDYTDLLSQSKAALADLLCR